MAHHTSSAEPRIIDTLRSDLKTRDLHGTVKRDFLELRDFLLTKERKSQISTMKPIRRFFYMSGWLLKSLFLKLTPARRLLLIVGIIVVLMSRLQFNMENGVIIIDPTILGTLLILFVLGLELKDKLLAHEELEAGRAVQEALRPESNPHVPGWDIWLYTRSANEVGGDLVDFVRLDDERGGVAIGDVAGKGLHAALLTAKLQATLKAIAPDFVSLSSLGAKLNEIYCRDGLKNIFASLAYAEVRSNSGLIRLLNAGHMRPILLHSGRVELLEKGGPALGLMAGVSYTERLVELTQGDTLFLYSDGLIDASNMTGEFFGEGRLTATLRHFTQLPARIFGERLLGEIDRFIGDAKATDDLSIVIMKRISTYGE